MTSCKYQVLTFPVVVYGFNGMERSIECQTIGNSLTRLSYETFGKYGFYVMNKTKFIHYEDRKQKSVRNTKNGRLNLSGLIMVMNYMISKAKGKIVYNDNPNEEKVMEMFHKISGSVFALNKYPCCETFLWHSFTMSISA